MTYARWYFRVDICRRRKNKVLLTHTPEHILKQYWGYDAFRPNQRDIIDAALQGEDVLALLPTGGGKSVCYQVPALCMEGMCIVVSPLIALMKDQVEQLKRRGIPAAAVFSGMNHRALDIVFENAANGAYKLLYLSPERLQTDLAICLPLMKRTASVNGATISGLRTSR
jgi:ATP-dependent DNA helicase RecQ